MIRRGQVYIADLDPGHGSEPGKKRPVVVVQTNLINRVHTSTMVCPLTSQIDESLKLLRVHLDQGEGGIRKRSDILIDQVRAVDNHRLIEMIGQVPSDKMSQLSVKLRVLLDL
jgi:mRNA interferase MazF